MHIMKILMFFLFFAFCNIVYSHEKIKIGNIVIDSEENKVYFSGMFASNFTVLPGGRIFPPLFIYENGDAAIGNSFLEKNNLGTGGNNIESKFLMSGSVEVNKAKKKNKFYIQDFNGKAKKCSFIDKTKWMTSISSFERVEKGDGLIALAGKSVGILMPSYNDAGIENYIFSLIDLSNCQEKSVTLDNLDYFSEIGWSLGGKWWIVGSTEQTLLVSDDGLKWRNIKLPKSISSLVSAFVSSEREIWLAAAFEAFDENLDPLLIRSLDGGLSWEKIKCDSPSFKDVPLYWLEGQSRVKNVLLK